MRDIRSFEEKTTVVVEGLAAVSIRDGEANREDYSDEFGENVRVVAEIDRWVESHGLGGGGIDILSRARGDCSRRGGEEDSSLKMESTTTGGVSIGAAATKAARDIEAASVGSEGNLITSRDAPRNERRHCENSPRNETMARSETMGITLCEHDTKRGRNFVALDFSLEFTI